MEFYLCALINTIVYGSPHELGQSIDYVSFSHTLSTSVPMKAISRCVWSVWMTDSVLLDNGYKINVIRSLPNHQPLAIFRCKGFMSARIEQWNLIEQPNRMEKELMVFNTVTATYTPHAFICLHWNKRRQAVVFLPRLCHNCIDW